MSNNYKSISMDPITAVIGFGKTGKGALDFLLARQKQYGHPSKIYLFNDTPIDNPEEQKNYESQGIIFLVGETRFQELFQVGRIIVSPGVDARTPRFREIRDRGIEILSEIELAFSSIDSQSITVIAVTGTNGKSTTVSLIHHLLKCGGFNSFLAGNIGTPFISEIQGISKLPNVVVVLEVSSFQLEEIKDFRPHIGLILNLTPDHLDRYPSLDDYYNAKINLVKNQRPGDVLILNYDDPGLKQRYDASPGTFGPGRIVWFSLKCQAPGSSGGHSHSVKVHHACISGETLYLNGPFPGTGSGEETISLKQNPLRGLHNLENVMAASLAARFAGMSPAGIEENLASFRGLAHRMEFSGKIGNVEFINDSKATNVDATIKSIASIREPLAVILGGKDKGSDFTVLVPLLRDRAKKILLIGKSAGLIRQQLADTAPDLQTRLEDVRDLDHAAAQGLHSLESTGGVVLLAPGCASFDMFKNFEHRGQVFKEAVIRLKEKLDG